MADYKGLNIRFRGDSTEASKALNILSSQAKAAQGNLTGAQNALKNVETNGKALNDALKEFRLEQVGKQADAARGKLEVYGKSLVELQKNLAAAQEKLATNKARLEELPDKYDAVASKAQQFGSRVSQSMADVVAAQDALSKAKVGTAEYDEAFQRLDDAVLKNVQSLTAETDAVNKVFASYGTIEGRINSAEEAIRSNGAAIDSTKEKMLAAQSTAQAYEAQHKSMSVALEASKTGLHQFGEGATKAGENLKSVGDSLTGFADKMTLVSTAVMATFGRNVISQTEDFGNAISQLGGYLGISGSQLDSMSEQALKWGKDTQFSATEAANAMNELAKGGMTQVEITGGAMQATMQLAAAGELDMASAAEIAVQSIKTFGLQAEDASAVADALAGAANESTAEVADLAAGFSQVGGAANMAGWDINEVIGALALLADRGFTGAEAGTTLKTMLQRLASPTKKASETMNALGIEVYDSQGKMVDAMEVIRRFESALDGLSDEQRNKALLDIFGQRGVNGMSAMLQATSEQFQSYIDVTKQAGYATEMAQSRMGDLGWALEYLRGEAETAAVNFGTALTPTITGVAKALEDAIAWFNGMSKSQQESIANMALMAAATGPVISVVGHLASGVGGLVSSVGEGAKNIATFATAMKETGDIAASLNTVSEGLAGTLSTGLVGLGIMAAVAAVGVFASGMAEMAERLETADKATRGLEEATGNLGKAYGEYSKNIGDAIDSTTELRDRTKELTEEQAKLADEISGAWGELGTQEATVDAYVSEIDRLSSAANLSESDMSVLADSIGKLNDITGTSIDIIDKQTGKLSLSKEQIHEVVEAWKRQQEINLASDNKEQLIAKQAEAEKALADATKVTTSAMDENAKSGGYFAGAANNVSAAAVGAGQDIDQLRKNYESATKALDDANATIAKGEYRFSDLSTAMVAAGVSSEKMRQLTEEQMRELASVFDGTVSSITSKLREFGAVSGDVSGQFEDAGDQIEDAADEAAKAIEDAAERAIEAQKRANEDIVTSAKRANEDAVNLAKQANDQIYNDAKRAYDRAYEELNRELDREYQAQSKAYEREADELSNALDEEYRLRQAAYKDEEDLLSKSLDAEYQARSKAYDQEYSLLSKQLDREYQSLSKSLSSQLSAIKSANDKAYKLRKSELDAESKALSDSLSKQQKELSKALSAELSAKKKADSKRVSDAKAANDAEVKAFQAATKQRIAAIDEEYRAKLKLLEADPRNAEIEQRIKELEAEGKADDKAAKERERAEKESELRLEVERAKTRRKRADAEKALNDYLLQVEEERRDEARQAEVESLREEQSLIKEDIAAKKDALKEEYDERKSTIEESRAAELEQIRESNDLEIEALREMLAAEEEAISEANTLRVENLKAANDERLAEIADAHSRELEQLKSAQSERESAISEANSERLAALKEHNSEILSNLKESQKAELQILKDSNAEKLQSFKDENAEELRILKDSNAEQVQSLKDFQSEQLSNLKLYHEDVLQQQKYLAEDELTILKNSLDNQITALKRSQEDQITALKRSHEDQIAQMKAQAKNATSVVKSSTKETSEAFEFGVRDIPEKAKTVGEKTVANFLEQIDELPNVSSRSADTTGHNLWERLNAHVMPTTNASKELRNAALRDIQGLPDETKDIGSKSGTALADELGLKKQMVESSSKELEDSALKHVNDLPAAFQKTGESSTTDLASGMDSTAYLVSDAADVLARYQEYADMSGQSHTWGYDFDINLANGMYDAAHHVWDATMYIAQTIAGNLAHSIPKTGPLSEGGRGEVVWGEHLVDNLVKGMRSRESELATQTRRMASIVKDEFQPDMGYTASVSYDARPIANAVHEALRAGVPQHQGVTVVVNEMNVRKESDIRRVSEGLNTLVANAERRGW